MLDIKQIRQQPDWFKEKLATRGVQPEEIDAVLELDAKRRELLQRTETLKAKRNEASKKIGEAKRAKQSADEAIAEMRQVGEDIKALDEQVEANDKDLFDKLAHLPNVPHEGVPVSLTEDGAEELRKVGQARQFDFEPKHHWEIGENLGILDFERAGKVSGSRFVYYVGLGAQLERALYNFMLDEHMKEGYTEVLPPYIVNAHAMYGTGQFPKFKQDVYQVNGEDMSRQHFSLFKMEADTTYYPVFDLVHAVQPANIGSEDLKASLKRVVTGLKVIIKDKNNGILSSSIDSMVVRITNIAGELNFYTAAPQGSPRTVAFPLVRSVDGTQMSNATVMLFPSFGKPEFQMSIILKNGNVKSFKQTLNGPLEANSKLTLTLTLGDIFSEESSGEFTLDNWNEESQTIDVPSLD